MNEHLIVKIGCCCLYDCRQNILTLLRSWNTDVAVNINIYHTNSATRLLHELGPWLIVYHNYTATRLHNCFWRIYSACRIDNTTDLPFTIYHSTFTPHTI